MPRTSYKDSELGVISIIVNRRARQITMRASDDGIRMTIPPRTTLQDVKKCIEKHREELHKLRSDKQAKTRFVDFSFSIHTDLLTLEIVEGKKEGIYLSRRTGWCQISCSPDTDFESIQKGLRAFVVAQLRFQAKSILFPRLTELAQRHGFSFRSVKIQTSHSRWGSCSADNNINLSVFMMTLPSRLVDYVLLHELCHTVHHNHSEEFWALMDQVTNNEAQALRHELRKNYTTDI